MTPAERRILVVEDDDTLRETLTEVLVEEGHEVRAAAHGHEALDHLDGWEPHLILLDLMMPTMDAFAFRTRQRQLGIAPRARTIVVSAARDLEHAVSLLDADAWIAKPFRLQQVVDAVDDLLSPAG
ncbi:MAG: response regulator [Chloroflexota bacterium]|nr:response regulator [Chloroflexota bacterium]